MSAGDLSKVRRIRVIYSGRVQGVGFRFTAERVALDVGVNGWVRNLPNQTVELLAEGPATAVEKLLGAIQASSVSRHIKSVKITDEPYRGEFDDFRIEFHLGP
ncbi:MAG: acylphosphatase [Candidatus Omnitrophica bacterium]|nr:acylphosphatase [Candidatus Omnitrophota bacterium]